ncbi:SET domain-containing protein [Hypoxylon trugodes]|uniref:SET domain-containing protein n=1 Tax=Hypoxylon trugodes TaxID=326681 RepID=UPI00218E13F0|nr:SET domain-containing protein [Hypoxylon trugodes]KAI1390792.1 SET domain-containing protein [Hypoxylon trugodes]
MAMLRILLAFHFALALANTQPSHQESQICIIPNPLLTIPAETCLKSSSPVKQDDQSSKKQPPKKVWRLGGLCLGLRADKHCVFANPTFNHGEGITVITTMKSMSAIATRPVFTGERNERPGEIEPNATGPYREVVIEGKGIGLVATRKIRAGELIMALTPSVMVSEDAVKSLSKRDLSALLVRASEQLPSHHKENIEKLSTHSETKTQEEKLHKILETNSFRTGYHDGDNPFYSLFTEISRINHDCRPTCAYYFDHRDFHQRVLALRDIEPDEELTITYYDPIQTHSVRQEILHKEWGFQCACKRCSADASTIAESNHRVTQIQALKNELDDHSAASNGSSEKAETLVSLYKEEGILGRLNDAYYRAAIEYIGVGDIENAKKYATLCIDHGLLFIGPDRPFIKEMQQLIENPTGHPKWEFRLKKN